MLKRQKVTGDKVEMKKKRTVKKRRGWKFNLLKGKTAKRQR